MNLGIIIQARMNSTRLPGKVLMNIGEKSILEHIFSRLTLLAHSTTDVVATTDNSLDDSLVELCETRGFRSFRGDEKNVLDRYYRCATSFRFDQVVRLTGDNPFIDIEELDRLIALHIEQRNDFTQSFSSLPIGVGAEIFSFRALERSFKNAKQEHHFEHVDEYILEHPDDFQIADLAVPDVKRRPEIRLTVDTLEDYDRSCWIYERASKGIFSTEEAIQLCLQYASNLRTKGGWGTSTAPLT